MIAAPHTSNWDLVIMLACAWTYGCSFNWLGKKEIFRMWLLGPFLRWTGGVPIDRGASQDTVAQAVKAFREADRMHLAVSPEGTRSHRHHWRSGFYHIALGAGVPIAFGFIDYATRRAGYGPTLVPTGDVRADMDAVRAFYAPIKGKYPDKQAPVRLQGEDAAQGA
jgi:1-acyl-sn-glycerol-3-phosphate acyltransferase